MGEATIAYPWRLPPKDVFAAYRTSKQGISKHEASVRLRRDGINDIRSDDFTPAWRIFLRQFTSPLVVILLVAGCIAIALGETMETVLTFIMVFVGGILGFFQEYRSERSLRTLRKKMARKATVIREGKPHRVLAQTLVVGDVVELERGSVVPADLRLVSVDDLEIDESVLTGESLPVRKHADPIPSEKLLPSERLNIAFSGTHVVLGSGYGVVISVAGQTEIGRTASLLTERGTETDFQKGIRAFGVFLLQTTAVLTIVVAVGLGFLRGNWAESVLFALALAVGISPELLPVIVTVSLARGASVMSKKSVLVKRLEAIEDLGNADVFCTDKTGTLTEGKLSVSGAFTPAFASSDEVLLFAGLCTERAANGHATNPIDAALLEACGASCGPKSGYTRRHTIHFDYVRRCMGVVVEHRVNEERLLIVKGALDEVLSRCTTISHHGTLTDERRQELRAKAEELQKEGKRLLAVAVRSVSHQRTYGVEDEANLALAGFVAVRDVPKTTAKEALLDLENLGVRVLVLTGDSASVTRAVLEEIGVGIHGLLTGRELETLHEDALRRAVEHTNVFTGVTPEHKLRIIRALKANNHTVGFMGDGVNDAPALRAADVGISFEEASDVAREAADVVLLKKRLSVLADGIREGRRTFVNMRTYIYATISSNFGNMFTVACASFFLPFIPLLPAQIILLNILSDVPMLAISEDRVGDKELARPKRLDIHKVASFMYFFGSISSIADFATFGLLLFVAIGNIAHFRSGWFLESLLTEIVIIFLVRTRKTSLRDLPSSALLIASALGILITFVIVQVPAFAHIFSLEPLSSWLIGALLLIVLGYAVLIELGKIAYYRFSKQADT